MKKLAILFGMVLLMPVVSHADNTGAGHRGIHHARGGLG